MWKYFAILGLFLVCLIPLPVLASTTADVVVTATGIVVASPGNFAITYISDYEVGISWTIPVGVANTMIRVATGRIPKDRNDGYLVYYGAGTGFSDTNVDLTSFEMPFYRAWSQRADGVWEEIGTNKAADFMSQAWAFIGILIFFAVAMGFSIYCWARHQGLLGLLSFLLWFIFVVFSFGRSLERWDLYYDFGLLGSLMGLIMMFTSIFMIIQKQTIPGEDEEEQEESAEDYVARIEEHRKKIDEAVRKRRGEY